LFSGQAVGNVITNGVTPDVWKFWAVESLGNNQYHFKCLGNNKYLSAQNDGSIIANRDVAGAWEVFTLVPGYTLGTVALKSSFNLYMSSQQNTNVVTIDRSVVGAWESWTVLNP